MRDKVIFILLDAFRNDYIEETSTPFIYSKIKDGAYAKALKTVPGFTQRTAIFSGTNGIESGMFTMFNFDKKNSPYRELKRNFIVDYFSKSTHIWNLLPSNSYANSIELLCEQRFSHYLNSIKRRIVRDAKQYSAFTPVAHIPINLLPELGLSEDNTPIYLPKASRVESIFDLFYRDAIRFEYLMFPKIFCNDMKVFKSVLALRESEADIIMAQFSDTDELIHLCGPSSPKRKRIVSEIDRKVEIISKHYGNKASIIIIGDHGMADVKEEINITEILKKQEKKSNVKHLVDYLVFLDSTMARFKYKTEKGKQFLGRLKSMEILKSKGYFIDKSAGKEYNLPLEDGKYGDLIWRADVGVLIFPDYFHDKKTHNKGMHGYDSNASEMKGFFLAFGGTIKPNFYEEANLVDVCPSICKLLELKPPRNNQGVSLIND